MKIGGFKRKMNPIVSFFPTTSRKLLYTGCTTKRHGTWYKYNKTLYSSCIFEWYLDREKVALVP